MNPIQIAGDAHGPILRRAGSLRWGEWQTLGCNGHNLIAARLWRMWRDPRDGLTSNTGGPSGGSGQSGSGNSGSGQSGQSGGGSGGTPWTSGNAHSYQAQIVEQVCPIYENDPSIWNTDSAGGDVSGIYSNLSVIRLRGRGISTTAPTTGQALLWDGTNWTPGNVSGVPVGSVSAFLNTVPSDWLELVGGTANRTTDANLFAYMGTLYGAGDGSTTFGIPDARGRTLIGAGTGTGLTLRTLAATLGSESVGLVAANNGPHAHQKFQAFGDGGTAFSDTNVWANVNGITASAAGFTESSGSGTPHENMQPSLVIRWAVKR